MPRPRLVSPPARWRGRGTCQPFSIDIGRAAVIAEEPRKRGYSRCFADEVTAELGRPEPERGTIGHLAAELPESAEWP